MCKLNILLIVLLILIINSCNTDKKSSDNQYKNDIVLKNVYDLAKRVLNEKSDNFVFERTDKEVPEDYFEISKLNNKILIKGNNGVSMASGLNWYLKKYCNAQFTLIDKQLTLPAKLPMPASPERVQTPYRYRYFFNVCTFSYTMAWWDWQDWERQIDWMAMNGINFPLAITGQEAVWYEVYKELGFSEKQIGDFIVGPAYFPWGWMGNVDGLGGPVPKSWMEKHKVLQQQILQRERALGMTPILQGFTGHVPESVKEVFPDEALLPPYDYYLLFLTFKPMFCSELPV